jgi:beta-exotoxin I transport system permease protein
MALRERLRPASLHSVFERTFHEERRAVTGWTVGLVALALTYIAMFPTIRGNQLFSQLFESYPKAIREMFGVADYTSGPGYLRAEVFSLTAPLLLSIFAIVWGSDLTAGEEQRRTIDILMANPVSRRRVVLEKWAAFLIGTAIAAAGLWLTLLVTGPLVRLDVAVTALSAATLASWLVAVVFGTIALLVGAATGRRGLARGLGALVAVTAYLVSSLSELVGALRPIRPASPWYHALGVDPLTGGFQPFHLGLLVAALLVAAALAVVAFEHRDLGT